MFITAFVDTWKMLDAYSISNARPLHKSRTGGAPRYDETRRDENGSEGERGSVFRCNFQTIDFQTIGLFFVNPKRLMHYLIFCVRLMALEAVSKPLVGR